jgi:hypothetical protein
VNRAKELWKIPFVDDTMGRRILDISEGLFDQLIEQLKNHVLHCK